MGKAIVFIQFQLTILLFFPFHMKGETTYPLTVVVKDLRNSNGVVQFALYDNSKSFPDEHYKKYFRKHCCPR